MTKETISILMAVGMGLSAQAVAFDDGYEAVTTLYYKIPINTSRKPLHERQRFGLAVNYRNISLNSHENELSHIIPLDIAYTGIGTLEFRINGVKALSTPMKVMQNDEEEMQDEEEMSDNLAFGPRGWATVTIVGLIGVGIILNNPPSRKDYCEGFICGD